MTLAQTPAGWYRDPSTGLSLGIGPWVCICAGVIGVLGSQVLLPIGHRVVIRSDGSEADRPVGDRRATSDD